MTQANKAKDTTIEADAIERVQVEVLGSYGADGNISIDDLNKNLGNIDGLIYNGQALSDSNKIESLPVTVTLDGYDMVINAKGSVTKKITVAEAKTNETVFADNTTITDTYGNSVTIPVGFKIASDSATDVTGGVVIEDATYTNTKGSQFVWIPVGTVTGTVNEVEKTETITLGRYVFDSSGNIDTTLSVTNPSDQLKTSSTSSSTSSYYFTEGLKNETTSNAHAKDIETFITSANNNHGYYLGRYEAGDSINTSARTSSTSDTNTMVCKAGKYVYNYVTQSQASSLSQSMYDSSEFTSDLINSYAWDTAIVFIQTFGEESNSKAYSRTVGISSTSTSEPQKTGTNILRATGAVDKQCNIFDMAGNTVEWSTETSSGSDCPFVGRGGVYSTSYAYTKRSRQL